MTSYNDNLEKLKTIIKAKQTLNGNKSGTTLTSLIAEMKIDLSEIKILLNVLHKKKQIIIRDGVNQKLVFLKR